MPETKHLIKHDTEKQAESDQMNRIETQQMRKDIQNDMLALQTKFDTDEAYSFSPCSKSSDDADFLDAQHGRKEHEHFEATFNKGALGCRQEPVSSLSHGQDVTYVHESESEHELKLRDGSGRRCKAAHAKEGGKRSSGNENRSGNGSGDESNKGHKHRAETRERNEFQDGLEPRCSPNRHGHRHRRERNHKN